MKSLTMAAGHTHSNSGLYRQGQLQLSALWKIEHGLAWNVDTIWGICARALLRTMRLMSLSSSLCQEVQTSLDCLMSSLLR